MKKILFFGMLFLLNIGQWNAECTYKEQRELNNLANYIQTIYEYNESTGKFDLTFTNLQDKFLINYENDDYYPSAGSVVISGVDLGTRFSAEVLVSSGECIFKTARLIRMNLPFRNQYYQSNLCAGHENLNVCSYKFLNYELNDTTFLGLIQKENANQNNKPEEKPKTIIKLSLIDQAVEAVKTYYVPVIIVIVTSGITISLYSVVIRKMKHGI